MIIKISIALLIKNLISVKVNETKESIINLMNKYNLVVLPVLNNKNQLIGRITIDDVYLHLKRETNKLYLFIKLIIDSLVSLTLTLINFYYLLCY